MSQHDQVLDNANGLTFRTDLNAALAALFSASSGATEPTTKVPGQLWFDTGTAGTNLLKVRDQTNAFWITVYSAASDTYDEQFAKLAAQENLLLNGGFGVNQAAIASAPSSAVGYFSDGWLASGTLAGATFAVQGVGTAGGVLQVGPGRGRVTVQTAKGSLAAGDYMAYSQKLEGVQIRHLGWGRTDGKAVALRFGFKGPAGTYGVSLNRLVGATTDNYMTTFTVAAGEANADKIVFLNIPPPTVNTYWDNTTAAAFILRITLACGTNFQGTAGWGTANVLSTSAQFNGFSSTSNVFEIFDVKMCSNPFALTADPGFHGYDTVKELLRAQRYLQTNIRLSAIFSSATSGAAWRVVVPFPVPMRIAPTVTQTTAGTTTASGAPSASTITTNAIDFIATPSATGQSGVLGYVYTADAQL